MQSIPWSFLFFGALAAFITGMAKCGVPGLGILAVPLMALALPARESVGALLPILIAGDLFAIALYRRRALWPWILRLAPWVAVGLGVGAWGLGRVDDASMRRLLGILVLSMVALDRTRRILRWDRLADHPATTAATGALAGAATTLGNAAGPIMTLYLLGRRVPKDYFVGTAAWFFFLVNLCKIPVFLGHSMLTRRMLWLGLALVPMIGLGAWAGVRALKWFPERTFRGVVLALTVVGGLRLALN